MDSYTLALPIKVVNWFISSTLPPAIKTFCRIASIGMPRRMGAFAEFERALIRERQREGIALAKGRGAYKGRKKALSEAQIEDLMQRVGQGQPKAAVARAFGISRETLYQYLREKIRDG